MNDLSHLAAIMTRLRDPANGCPWDLAQDFDSIAPYTIEEAYEVADAIERRDFADLRGELGDLLFQVIFHAQMAEEAQYFSLSDVVDGICAKMQRRHPHIFGTAQRANSANAQKADWEAIKAAERTASGTSSALEGVANALPALMRAEKLQSRAARVGFDWPDPAPVRAKIVEELHEFEAAKTDAHRAEEAGDLLFAVVNYLRHHGIDAEAALRAGNAKFERRFRAMEALAGGDFPALTLEAQEVLWNKVKQAP